MNILYLANHLNTGGITSYLLTLGEGMIKRGHRVFIASSGGEKEGRFLEKKFGMIKVPLKTKSEASPKIFISFLKLLPFIKKENIDIIHANTRVTQVLAFWLSKFSPAVFVSTCHGFFRPHFFRRRFPLWGRSVIAVSEEVKGHLMNELGVAENTIRLVYNGIDTERFKTASRGSTSSSRRDFGIKEGPVVSIIARLSDVKGHRYLISAFKDVLKEIPSAQLLICGEGKMHQELAGLVSSLGISGNVYFIPSVEDTRKVLSVTDVFVMPSLQEGLGLALMEAMAYGLAVVASDVGGIRSLVKDRLSGILVKPKDVAGLSVAVIELLKSEKKRKELGESARRSIESDFSQVKMTEETLRFYKDVLFLK